jgi:UDP-glucose 4-epimerase
MVVPRFVRQALRGEPITVYGSGDQVRSFAHVLDIVPATVALLDREAARGQVVNLGSSTPVSINELAVLVRELTGSRSEIVHVPFEEAYAEGFEDILARQPDISRARALIGFRPRRDLTDIVQSVIEWERAAVGT